MPLINPDDPATWANEWRLRGGVYGGISVICGYIRKLMLPAISRRADAVISYANLTASSNVWICGGDYGWLQYQLETKLPGISVGTIDGSTLVRDRALLSETDEIKGYLDASGLVEGTDAYNEALAFLDDGLPKAPVPILDSLVLESRGGIAARNQRDRFFATVGSPDIYICDGALPWLTDAEAIDTVNGMLIDCSNILLITLLEGTGSIINPAMNIKTAAGWKALFGADHPIMSVGSYQVL